MTEVRVNLQTELEGAVKDEVEGCGHRDNASENAVSGMDVVKGEHDGLALMTQPVTPRAMGRFHHKGAWCKELASLPRYNYYELETELVNLTAAPITLAERLRCSNPLATLLDQVSSCDCHVMQLCLCVWR